MILQVTLSNVEKHIYRGSIEQVLMTLATKETLIGEIIDEQGALIFY